MARLRSLITLDADPAVPRDAAVLRVTRGPAIRAAARGRTGAPAIEVAVEHTRGSAALPLTDDELLDKVRALFGPVLGEAAADRARDAVDKLPGAEDTSALSPRCARPGRPGVMTSTDEILAVAAAAAATPVSRCGDGGHRGQRRGDGSGPRRVQRGRRARRRQRAWSARCSRSARPRPAARATRRGPPG